VVIRGAGDGFSGGADLGEMHALLAANQSLQGHYVAVDQALTRLRTLNRPTIARIHGACMGGGCMICMTADFRIASNDASFGITPAKLGLTITTEQIADLIRIVGEARAKQLLYTGQRIDSATALAWGLVNQLVPPADLEQSVRALAEQLQQVSQRSVRAFKTVMGEMARGAAGDHALCKQLYEDGFSSDDFREGAQAFLDRRPAKFPSNQ
jgi:enoyl-CoA hydratase/carnithine racemase